MSILLLYKRTFPINNMHYETSTVGALIFANTIASIPIFRFECKSVARFWDAKRHGSWVDEPMFFMLSSLCTLITDFIIYIVPMPVIWRLQMTIGRKVGPTLVLTQEQCLSDGYRSADEYDENYERRPHLDQRQCRHLEHGGI